MGCCSYAQRLVQPPILNRLGQGCTGPCGRSLGSPPVCLWPPHSGISESIADRFFIYIENLRIYGIPTTVRGHG